MRGGGVGQVGVLRGKLQLFALTVVVGQCAKTNAPQLRLCLLVYNARLRGRGS